FFSSRRRHTRSTRDWSSDVCSSDLPTCMPAEGLLFLTVVCIPEAHRLVPTGRGQPLPIRTEGDPPDWTLVPSEDQHFLAAACIQIGRASCRERVEIRRCVVSCDD